MNSKGPWQILGIAKTDDAGAIRRAYADKLRAIDPDTNVDGFSALRSARDQALRSVRAAGSTIAETSWDDGENERHQLEVAAQHTLLSDEPDAPRPEPFQPVTRLVELLLPGAEQSDESFSYEEFEEAQECVAAIIEDILDGDVVRQQQGSNWLAELMAYAWPRSAWLLSDASTELGWADERGQLGEHPEKAFLNDRLASMNFEKALQQQGHPYHKAWVELSKPGEKSWLSHFRVSKNEVHRLLETIREQYPELEDRLDPARVFSWGSKSEGISCLPIWLGSIALFPVLGLLADLMPEGVDRSDPPPISGAPQLIDELDDSIPRLIFGEPVGWVIMEEKAPVLFNVLVSENLLLASGSLDFLNDEAIRKARSWMLIVGSEADWNEMFETKQLLYKLASQIRRDLGAGACVGFLESGVSPPIFDASDDIREREKALSLRLLQDNHTDNIDSANSSKTAPIPGRVILAILQETGLSDEELARALKMEGTDEHNCATRLSLMKHVLRRPGDVTKDLLQIL